MNDLSDDVVPASNDVYGASSTIVPDNHGGAIIYENGRATGQVVPSAVYPRGFQLYNYGSSQHVDMGNAMDSLNFNMNEVRMPWQADNIPTDEDGVIGTPDKDVEFWQPQTTAFTCAVQAQRGIIEEFTGEKVSESQLVYEATANGWLTDQGMSPSDVGKLLEIHGIPCHPVVGASIEDLMRELSMGHKVVIGVDSGELWTQDSRMEDFFHQSADHAIWVTGVDISDPANPKVIINDSGNSRDGAGKAYDLNTFTNAWEDSGFFYVSTDEAPPDMSFAASSGFNLASGRFPDIISYLDKAHPGFGDGMEGNQAYEFNISDNTIASLSDMQIDKLFRQI